VAELGNPLKCTGPLKSRCALYATTVERECHIQVTGRPANARGDHQLRLEPAHGVYYFTVDLDLEVEVAAGGSARGAAQRDSIATVDGLTHLDSE
jgi:hypothetical protein